MKMLNRFSLKFHSSPEPPPSISGYRRFSSCPRLRPWSTSGETFFCRPRSVVFFIRPPCCCLFSAIARFTPDSLYSLWTLFEKVCFHIRFRQVFIDTAIFTYPMGSDVIAFHKFAAVVTCDHGEIPPDQTLDDQLFSK